MSSTILQTPNNQIIKGFLLIITKKNNNLYRYSIFSYNSENYPVTENLTNYRVYGTIHSNKNNACY
jgi:hypothetical protein